MRTRLLFAACFLIAACVPSENDKDTPGATPTPGHPEGPQILSFGTDVGSVTEGESVLFSAIVTDPDGPADVIGGTLEGPNNIVYGNFSGSEQSFSLRLSWDELDAVESIDFGVSGASREFTARFFDAAGHVAQLSTQIALHCDGASAEKGRCEFLVQGPYNVASIQVAHNECNVNLDALQNSETVVTVEDDEVTLLDGVEVYYDDGILFGTRSWTHDWNPVFDCIEQRRETYTGRVIDTETFELEMLQTREVLGGDLCMLVNSNEGVLLPCESRIDVRFEH